MLGVLVFVKNITDPDVAGLQGDDDVGSGAILSRVAKAGIHEPLAGEDLVDDLAGGKDLLDAREIDIDGAG